MTESSAQGPDGPPREVGALQLDTGLDLPTAPTTGLGGAGVPSRGSPGLGLCGSRVRARARVLGQPSLAEPTRTARSSQSLQNLPEPRQQPPPRKAEESLAKPPAPSPGPLTRQMSGTGCFLAQDLGEPPQPPNKDGECGPLFLGGESRAHLPDPPTPPRAPPDHQTPCLLCPFPRPAARGPPALCIPARDVNGRL